MKYTLTINTKFQKCPITIESGLFSNIGNILGQNYPGKKLVIITDENIYHRYDALLKKQFGATHCNSDIIVLPSGEGSKSFNTLKVIYKRLLDFQVTRDDVLIALGGGVVGDITGFAAATFLRGVDFVQIPTTLLSQVDSSIGGKNAVNLPEGKNMIGTFYHPSSVYIDPDFIKTLSDFSLADGMAEVIKYGCIADADLFSDLIRMSSFHYADLMESIIYRCCLIKKQLIEQDERDHGVRMLVNFGHTLGHAIEHHGNGKYGHGQSVAMGMQITTEKSEALGFTAINTSAMLKEILLSYNLPVALPDGMDKEELIITAMRDKKRRGDKINLILLEKIGKAYLHPIDKAEIRNFI